MKAWAFIADDGDGDELSGDWKPSDAGGWRATRYVSAKSFAEVLQPLLLCKHRIKVIGIENCSAAARDGQMLFSVHLRDRVQFCEGLGCRLTISCRSRLCEGQLPAIKAFYRDLVRRVGAEAFCYGGWTLIEPAEYLASGAFHMGLGGLAPWHLEMPQKLYDSEGLDRQKYVRGVQWGNYLGPELNRRLDPDGSIADKFESWFQADTPSILRPMVIRCASGGAFYAFSQNPATWTHAYEESEPGFANNWELALWFHRQLRANGMLL